MWIGRDACPKTVSESAADPLKSVALSDDSHSANPTAGTMSDKPKAPEVGLLFPKDPRKGDERGSTFGNKNAWAAAIGAISEKDAERVFKEKQWRQKYNKCVYYSDMHAIAG